MTLLIVAIIGHLHPVAAGPQMEQSDSTDILSLCLWKQRALLLLRCDRPFNCLIQITCHRGPETARWHLLIICPAPVHTSSPGIWLPLGALCLAPIHSHLLSVSMSLIRAHFSHSHSPLVALAHTPTLFQFQSRHCFSSLLQIHQCVCMRVYLFLSIIITLHSLNELLRNTRRSDRLCTSRQLHQII